MLNNYYQIENNDPIANENNFLCNCSGFTLEDSSMFGWNAARSCLNDYVINNVPNPFEVVDEKSFRKHLEYTKIEVNKLMSNKEFMSKVNIYCTKDYDKDERNLYYTVK